MAEMTTKIFGGLPVARSAAGAGWFLCSRGGLCEIPKARGPRNAVTVRLDDISLTDLQLPVGVRAVKA